MDQTVGTCSTAKAKMKGLTSEVPALLVERHFEPATGSDSAEGMAIRGETLARRSAAQLSMDQTVDAARSAKAKKKT